LDHALQRAGAEHWVVADDRDAVALPRRSRSALDFAPLADGKMIAVLGARFMQPIEFHTTINNGVIAVPPEHLPLLSGGGATVIVVPDVPQGNAASEAGGLRRHFGAVHGGDPRAADNDRIDADLAQEYGHVDK
jgi:hypothetical protein